MRLFKAIALGGLAATVANADFGSSCGAVSTIYVTVPQIPTTEISSQVTAVSNQVAQVSSQVTELLTIVSTEAIIKSADIIPGQSRPAYAETTATDKYFLSFTKVISVLQATSTSVDANQGPYYFFEHNGTTVWLDGKTPPAGDALVTSTTTFVVDPTPTGPEKSSAQVSQSSLASLTTTFSTTFLTIFTTEHHTETLTESTSTLPVSANGFSSSGWNGWNATATTLRTVTGIVLNSSTAEPLYYQTAFTQQRKDATSPGGSSNYTKPANESEWSTLSARQVGAVVVITLDGAVVSWTNSFNGIYPPPSPVTISSIPTTPTSQTVTSTSDSETIQGYSYALSPSLNPVPSSSFTTSSEAIPIETSTVASPITITESLLPASLTQISLSLVTTSLSRYLNTSTATRSSTAASATPKFCGDSGKFTINFDDLPHFGEAPTANDYPPIFNPYHHLYFSQGFSYVPPPSDPFPPISPPQLGIYVVGRGSDASDDDGGAELIGELGAGPRASESEYWIDAYSAYLGCDNIGPANCIMTINGYNNYSDTRNVTQTVTLPPCPGLVNCTLSLVTFADSFRNLTGLQLIATVGGRPISWYVDDLQLGWSNNTCAAGLHRISQE
ncbi:hypothetical protein MMC12_002856 [Toensbergia leucococca]|nr:hypothetical protein [Toensbergia leucococca]